MAFVVDASVVVKLVLPEPDSSEAEALFQRGVDLHAPDLLLLEVASALWKAVRRAQTTEADSLAALRFIAQTRPLLMPVVQLASRALGLANETGCSVYDASYLALAEQLQITLVTADERLVALVAAAGVAIPVTRLADA